MTQRTQVLLIDDLDGGDADRTLTFSVGSTAYEIDMSDEHANEFEALMQPYVSVARRLSSWTRSGSGRVVRRNSSTPSINTEEVRAWAIENGYSVAPRGRLSRDVIQAWETKTPAPVEAEAEAEPVTEAKPRRRRAAAADADA